MSDEGTLKIDSCPKKYNISAMFDKFGYCCIQVN